MVAVSAEEVVLETISTTVKKRVVSFTYFGSFNCLFCSSKHERHGSETTPGGMREEREGEEAYCTVL
jgi:hypothetical protein